MGGTFSTSGSTRLTEGVNLTGFWRLYEIHRLVAQEAYPNCPHIAERLEVSRRTIERDVGRLKYLFGAPIEYDRKRRGYYYSESFELPSVRLREGEAIALFLGQRLLMQCKGTPFEEYVQTAMTKIRMLLPQTIEIDVERSLGAISFHSDPLRGDEVEVAERYQLLTTAIARQKTVATDYFTASRGTTTHRKIDPYHLRFADGAWYCIGYCHARREIRIFALDRMTGLFLTDDSFQVPADFSMEDYLAGSWSIERGERRRVVIEFDSYQAPYIVGKRWHPSQVLEELPDGNLRMTLNIGGSGEIMRWVMSMGSHAWIVEPEEIRKRIGEELDRAGMRYQAGLSSGPAICPGASRLAQ